MTELYFVRHATPNYENHDDASRELTLKGLEDRKLVTAFFEKKKIDVMLSSPYKRAIDTIQPLAEQRGLEIITIPDFRERKTDSIWVEDFEAFCKNQWQNFSYKLSDGESLEEVQNRNIAALEEVVDTHQGKTIVIGSHGTALATILNYYDVSFGYEGFQSIRKLMPFIVRFRFEENVCKEIRQYDLF